MFELRAPQSWFRWFLVLRISFYATPSVLCAESHVPQTQDLLSRFTGQLSSPYKPESGEAVAGIHPSSGPMIAGELGMPSSATPTPLEVPVHSTWKDAQLPYPRRPEQEDEHQKKRFRPTQATVTTLLRASFEPQPINDAAISVNSEVAQATQRRDAQSLKDNLPGSAHRAETIPEPFQQIVPENARSFPGFCARTAEPEYFMLPNSYVQFRCESVSFTYILQQLRPDTIYEAHRALGHIELSHLQLKSQHESLIDELKTNWAIKLSLNRPLTAGLQKRIDLMDHSTKAVLHIMRTMNGAFEPALCENENELLWYQVEAFKNLWALWNKLLLSMGGTQPMNWRLSQAERSVSRTEEFGLERSILNKIANLHGKTATNSLTWLAVEFTLCDLMLPLYMKLRSKSKFDDRLKEIIDDIEISHAGYLGVPEIGTLISFKKRFVLKQDCLIGKERTWLSPAQQASYRYWARYFHPKQPNIAMALASEVLKISHAK